MNPNISNKRIWEHLKSNPKYKKEATSWLKGENIS